MGRFRGGPGRSGQALDFLVGEVLRHHRDWNGKGGALAGDRAYVDAVLRDGADRARAIAEGTMKTVRDIVGLLQD